MSGHYGPPRPVWPTAANRGSRGRPLPPMYSPPVKIYYNAVYFANWRVYKDEHPSMLQVDAISHIFYAFAWVNSDGSVYLSDEYADTQKLVDGHEGCLRALASLKGSNRMLKVLLSVGGGGHSEHFPTVASDPIKRETFARTARALVDQFGLDGIDLDWEHPSSDQQGQDYISLLASLRRWLPSPYYSITSALPAGEWALRYIDLRHASNYLDLINCMAYDFAGPWTDASGHQAQLYTPERPHNSAATVSAHAAIHYMTSRGVLSSKIMLGVPAYGRAFPGANNIGQAFTASGDEPTLDYKDLPLPGSTEGVDEDVVAAYCVHPGHGFITYDNPRTVQLKADYVRQSDLAGLFYWHGTGDSSHVNGQNQPRSLVYAGYMALNS